MPPFDPLEFLTLARTLASGGTDEARLRSAISRAYYALFLVARDRTNTKAKKDVHKNVIDAVRNRKRTLGDELDSLRRLRVMADYHLLPIKPEDRNWSGNWQRAEKLVGRLLPGLQVL